MLNKGSHRITLKNIATIVSATTVSISAYLSIEMLFIWRKQQPGGMLGLLLWCMWGKGLAAAVADTFFCRRLGA